MASTGPGKTAVIDGIEYPVSVWATQQQGRELEESWLNGFAGGMGEWKREDGSNRYYWASNMEGSTYPVLRLRPQYTKSDTAVTNLTTTNPVYFISAFSTTRQLYVLAGRYSHKYSVSALGALTFRETIDHGANTILGRPALHKGKWYFPFGGTNNAKELTTITATTGDTFTDLDVAALHFTNRTVDGEAQLVRAHSINQIDIAAAISGTPAAADWSADNFEVGDSSLPITDLNEWGGEIAASKPDSVYRFDHNGSASPIQGFVGRSDTAVNPDDGAAGAVHGLLYYWPHQSGLWRFTSALGQPIGYDAAGDWARVSVLNLDVQPSSSQFHCVVAYGQWLYAAKGNQLYYGFIRPDDGTVQWHGAVLDLSGDIYLGITSDGPYLWVVNQDDLFQVRLETDGSLRNVDITATGRSAASTTHRVVLPEVDFGEPNREKQIRMMWVKVEGWDANASLQLEMYRDGATSATAIGSAYTTGATPHATIERAMTPGTNDLAYAVRPALQVETNGSYTPSFSDPRIVSCGIVAATATIYRVVIEATRDELKRTSQTPAGIHQTLRNLLDGPRVAILEPSKEGAEDTFNGRIIGLREEAIDADGKDGGGWSLTLEIERYDYGS